MITALQPQFIYILEHFPFWIFHTVLTNLLYWTCWCLIVQHKVKCVITFPANTIESHPSSSVVSVPRCGNRHCEVIIHDKTLVDGISQSQETVMHFLILVVGTFIVIAINTRKYPDDLYIQYRQQGQWKVTQPAKYITGVQSLNTCHLKYHKLNITSNRSMDVIIYDIVHFYSFTFLSN